MKVSVGEKAVIASGAVNSVGNEPVTFDLPGEPALKVHFRIDRAVDKASDGSWFDWKAKGAEGHFIVYGRNHNNAGLAEPVKIGQYSGRELLVSFRATTFDNPESYLLTYTFYSGAKV